MFDAVVLITNYTQQCIAVLASLVLLAAAAVVVVVVVVAVRRSSTQQSPDEERQSVSSSADVTRGTRSSRRGDNCRARPRPRPAPNAEPGRPVIYPGRPSAVAPAGRPIRQTDRRPLLDLARQRTHSLEVPTDCVSAIASALRRGTDRR